jgi:predicted nucleic-acid-binding protein
MIGLDTNVLVRYIVQDEPAQSAAATSMIESLTEESPGFVSLVAVLELNWVLRRGYHLSRERVLAVLRRLLDSVEVVVQEAELLRRLLSQPGDAELADAMASELGRRAGCEHTLTFDGRAARALAGMKLLKVR